MSLKHNLTKDEWLDRLRFKPGNIIRSLVEAYRSATIEGLDRRDTIDSICEAIHPQCEDHGEMELHNDIKNLKFIIK